MTYPQSKMTKPDKYFAFKANTFTIKQDFSEVVCFLCILVTYSRFLCLNFQLLAWPTLFPAEKDPIFNFR